MKERKSIKKKESNLKYILLAVAIVLAIVYVVYEKSDINLKDIELFEKKDKVENVIQSNYNSTGMADTFTFGGGEIILVFAVMIFGISIVAFIFPLFRGKTGVV